MLEKASSMGNSWKNERNVYGIKIQVDHEGLVNQVLKIDGFASRGEMGPFL